MGRLGFYFDMTRCIGCRACQVACKDKNRLEVGVIFRNAHTYSVGTFPSVRCYSYSGTCYHCAEPACVERCPTGAMYRAEDGVVLHDDELCTGCGTCVNACPYGNPKVLPEANIAAKCDSCKALRDAGGNPACVDACPQRALEFGDIDMLQEIHGAARVSLAVLPRPETTQPSLVVRAKEAAFDPHFQEITY